MSWFRRHFGLDVVDVGIHAALTVLAAAFVDSTWHGPPADRLVTATVAASVLLFALRRSLALRRADRELPGLTTGQMGAARLDELEQRVTQLEGAEARVLELEERLDFAERMLAQTTGEKALPSGGDGLVDGGALSRIGRVHG